MQTVQIRVDGIVQGVGFRFTARALASMYGLAGWVANRPDGSVEIEITGAISQLEAFRTALRESRVGHGITRWEESRAQRTAVHHGFYIR
ncbi:MAG: acylphosphatase [Kiritimatiellia bacterium]